MPVGRSSPQSWAASRPIFSELAACTPTSSRSGLPMIARNECRPTLPVENWITLRIVTTTCQLSVSRQQPDQTLAVEFAGRQHRYPALGKDRDDCRHLEPG